MAENIGLSKPIRGDKKNLIETDRHETVVLLDKFKFKGDNNALGIIYKRYYDKAVDFAKKKLGANICNRVDEDDIVSISWRKMIKYLNKREVDCSKEGKFMKLLRAIIIHTICDIARKKSVEKVMQTNNTASSQIAPVDRLSAKSSSPQTKVPRNLDLKSALNKLPLKEREAVILVEYEGYSPKEAALLLEVTSHAIRRWKGSGLESLKRYLDK